MILESEENKVIHRDDPMSIGEFLLLLIVAGICGSIGQSIVGGSRSGCLGSIAIGFVGALLGSWIAGKMALPEILSISIGGKTFPIIWTIAGAALFVAILCLVSGRKR